MLDVIISAMHGTNGEDGVSSVIANLYNIPFVGSNHISSGVLLDKYFSYAVLCSNGIRTIDTEFRYRNDKVDFDKYPLIIKPSRLGSSIGIYKANDENELIINLNKAFMFDNKVVIQPFIKEFKEYNQAVYINCGKLVFSNVEEVFKSDNILSFDDKYICSKTDKKHIFLEDVKLVSEITKVSEKIYKSLQLSGVVRIDYMFFDDKLYVNEVNTTPGSFAYYLYDYTLKELLESLIKNALFENQNKLSFVFKSNVLSQKYNYKK